MKKSMTKEEIKDLDQKMEAAGMIPYSKMIEINKCTSALLKHAGVNSLETFEQWLQMRYEESAGMFARLTVDKKEDDDLYEWVLAHNAVFKEVLIHFKAAMES